jgi:hypothetical protein
MKPSLVSVLLLSASYHSLADVSPFEFREIAGKAGLRYLIVTDLNDQRGVTFFFPHGADLLVVAHNSRLVVDKYSRRKS